MYCTHLCSITELKSIHLIRSILVGQIKASFSHFQARLQHNFTAHSGFWPIISQDPLCNNCFLKNNLFYLTFPRQWFSYKFMLHFFLRLLNWKLNHHINAQSSTALNFFEGTWHNHNILLVAVFPTTVIYHKAPHWWFLGFWEVSLNSFTHQMWQNGSRITQRFLALWDMDNLAEDAWTLWQWPANNCHFMNQNVSTDRWEADESATGL